MPIAPFHGNTFVAFMDISGFKVLMKDKDKKRAWRALDRLYSSGFDVINSFNREVEGLFVSDCGILFVRNCDDKVASMKSLLEATKKINEKMLDRETSENNFMLTTSIAYGGFKYQNRLVIEGIEKNAFCGKAYIDAFIDTEEGKPKIQPGQCRIVKENLPSEIMDALHTTFQNDGVLQLIKPRKNDNNHFYFYWMLENSSQIDDFEKQYTESYDLTYKGMIRALKMIRN